MKQFEIIDFHTHPFLNADSNICSHKESSEMTPGSTKALFEALGVSMIAGSVIGKRDRTEPMTWDYIRKVNDEALRLSEEYRGFYIPGFHVHPDFPDESCREIEEMHSRGVRLIGELVPYHDGWADYSCDAFSSILDCAAFYKMIVSFHSMDNDQMDAMVKAHPDVIFVAAHPGEFGNWKRHMERMAMSENYYLDLSGYGIFRHGMLRHSIDLFGKERFIFGSDYPTCSPAMYIGGVKDDTLLSDDEKTAILSENAKRLLGF